MTWFYASSVTVANGQTVVSVNAGDDIVIAQEQGGLIIGSNPPVEIKRTYLDGSSNKKIELSKPWPYGTQTNQPAVAFPTDGDLAAATAVLKTLIDGFSFATQADALAGTDNSKSMSALRVAQAFQQYGLGAGAIDLPNFTAVTANVGRLFRFTNTAAGKPAFINNGSCMALPYDSSPNTYFLGVGLRADSTRAAFLGYKSGAAGTPSWLELWDKGKHPMQTSVTDISGGFGSALLTPGSFGLGTNSTPALLSTLASANLDTLTIPSGLYRIVAADTGLKPNLTDFSMIQLRYNSVDAARIAIGLNGEMHTYASAGGVWPSTGWRRQYDNLNIQGLVGHDGAKNVGAAMEYGSNANGRYYKYADGRMICEIVSADVAFTANTEFTQAFVYPAAFNTLGSISGVMTQITGASVTNNFAITKSTLQLTSASECTYRGQVSVSQSHRVYIQVTGRWR